MHQVLIDSKLIISKGKKSINLLIEHLLSPPEKPLQPKTGKLKPRSWPCKNIILVAKRSKESKKSKKTCIKDFAIEKNGNIIKLTQAIIKRMRTHFSLNSKPKTDLGKILGKNSLGGDG